MSEETVNFQAEVGGRLKTLAKAKGWKNYELAEIVGVSAAHIKKYFEGKFNPLKFIDKLADGYCSKDEISWLLTGDGRPPISDKEKIERESGFRGAVPTYDYPVLANVYAGDPKLLMHEVIGEYYPFPYKKNNNRCFVLRVNGDSMETTLSDGDLVLCDMDEPVTDGSLVAVVLKNGKQYIKRFHDINFAFIQLSSDNPKFDTRVIDKNDIVAMYKVVQSVRSHV